MSLVKLLKQLTLPRYNPRVTSSLSSSLSQLRIRFQAKSKQVTSLEVITQVAYLTGQTNMAASWHPADRSKPGPDKWRDENIQTAAC